MKKTSQTAPARKPPSSAASEGYIPSCSESSRSFAADTGSSRCCTGWYGHNSPHILPVPPAAWHPLPLVENQTRCIPFRGACARRSPAHHEKHFPCPRLQRCTRRAPSTAVHTVENVHTHTPHTFQACSHCSLERFHTTPLSQPQTAHLLHSGRRQYP